MMSYNTERNKLLLSEYGRNMQRMVEYVAGIEDKKKRNEQAKAVLEIMAHLNPQLKNVDDFEHKLYDHMVMMSDFTIDIDTEFQMPEREEIFKKPSKLPYPQQEFQHRHYGKNIENMIAKACEEPDEEKRKAFAVVIGNYMKLVHENWSNEQVNNNVIQADIKRMSGGKLEISDESNLDMLGKVTKRPTNNQGGGGKRRKGQGKRSNYKRRKN